MKPRSRIEFSGSGLLLSRRTGSWGTGLFMLGWLTGWTVGCVFLLGGALGGETFLWLFGVPFWASWVFVAFQLLESFFGRESLYADLNGVVYEKRVLLRLRHRTVAADEIVSVGRFTKLTDSENRTWERGIEVRTSGRPVRFGQGLDDDERAYLQYKLNEALGLNDAAAGDAKIAPAVADLRDARQDRAAVALAPSDTRWRLSDDGIDLVFSRRGRCSWSTLGGVIFINLFWNGIVSVFLVGVFNPGAMGDESLGMVGRVAMGVFLVPFVGIGLAMLGGLIACLAVPFSTEWARFGRRELRAGWTVVCLPWARRYDLSGVVGVELDRDGRARRSQHNQIDVRRPLRMGEAVEGPARKVALVDADGQRVFEMDGLTVGEAEWWAQTLVDAYRGWEHRHRL